MTGLQRFVVTTYGKTAVLLLLLPVTTPWDSNERQYNKLNSKKQYRSNILQDFLFDLLMKGILSRVLFSGIPSSKDKSSLNTGTISKTSIVTLIRLEKHTHRFVIAKVKTYQWRQTDNMSPIVSLCANLTVRYPYLYHTIRREPV